ncbi:hypothetical protein IWX50DRAFT_647236 [Phyllosticta citricarpa]
MSDRVETTTPSSSGSESGSAELTAVVDELLNQLSTKFQGISKELLEKSKCGCPFTPLPLPSINKGIQNADESPVPSPHAVYSLSTASFLPQSSHPIL